MLPVGGQSGVAFGAIGSLCAGEELGTGYLGPKNGARSGTGLPVPCPVLCPVPCRTFRELALSWVPGAGSVHWDSVW